MRVHLNTVMHKNDKNRIKREERAIRAIFNEWDPIQGSRKDEYDCLIHLIIGALHKKSTLQEMASLIKEDFSEHFGIEVDDYRIKDIVQKLIRIKA